MFHQCSHNRLVCSAIRLSQAAPLMAFRFVVGRTSISRQLHCRFSDAGNLATLNLQPSILQKLVFSQDLAT